MKYIYSASVDVVVPCVQLFWELRSSEDALEVLEGWGGPETIACIPEDGDGS